MCLLQSSLDAVPISYYAEFTQMFFSQFLLFSSDFKRKRKVCSCEISLALLGAAVVYISVKNIDFLFMLSFL